MKTGRVAFVLCVIAFVVFGCGKVTTDPLVGVWRISVRDRTVLLTLRADHTYVLTISTNNKSEDIYGAWNKQESILALRSLEERGQIEFEILAMGKDEINFRWKNGREIECFKRVSDTTQLPTRAEILALSPEGIKERRDREEARLIDRAVLNNARKLAAAADQYFMENGGTSVALSLIVGPTLYIKTLTPVAGESYPLNFKEGATITISGIAGARTITYAP